MLQAEPRESRCPVIKVKVSCVPPGEPQGIPSAPLLPLGLRGPAWRWHRDSGAVSSPVQEHRRRFGGL